MRWGGFDVSATLSRRLGTQSVSERGTGDGRFV